MSNCRAAERLLALREHDGGALHQPPGTISGHHRVVQSRAECRAGRGHYGSRQSAEGHAHAPQPAGGFSGHRGILYEFAVQRASAHSGRAGHRVYRAGRSVRELHPPDYDSLHAAVGGRGSFSRADSLSPGFERRGDHRHRPADRHREEERHHDGRLRARRRAQARKERDRCNLRGLPAPLPPHHDDDDGRAAGRIAAGARHRLRLGVAPAARHRHGRRAAAKPGAHALHHARHLHLLRQSRRIASGAKRTSWKPETAEQSGPA